MFGYPDPSRRFTMGLGSIVYDVLDDYIVHASFQRYLASERSAALEHLHNLEDLNIYQNSVIIFDRGYYSEDMFRYCVEHQHLCLMRLKQNYNIAKKWQINDIHSKVYEMGAAYRINQPINSRAL